MAISGFVATYLPKKPKKQHINLYQKKKEIPRLAIIWHLFPSWVGRLNSAVPSLKGTCSPQHFLSPSLLSQLQVCPGASQGNGCEPVLKPQALPAHLPAPALTQTLKPCTCSGSNFETWYEGMEGSTELRLAPGPPRCPTAPWKEKGLQDEHKLLLFTFKIR